MKDQELALDSNHLARSTSLDLFYQAAIASFHENGRLLPYEAMP